MKLLSADTKSEANLAGGPPCPEESSMSYLRAATVVTAAKVLSLALSANLGETRNE